MWNELFKTNAEVFNIQKSTNILDNTYYLPFQCHEIDTVLNNTDLILPSNTIGIHWFNGGVNSKQYSIDLSDRLTDFKITNFLDQTIHQYIPKCSHKNTNTILLVSESSYPGGGGEEFLLDIANYFNNNNYTVYWMTLHDWGKSVHSTYIEIVKQSYTELQMPRSVDDMSNYKLFIR